MLPVAASDDVTLFCPEDGLYSFYNSPYPSHRLMTGVDIYADALSEGSAQSPVSGEILQVRRVKAPPGRNFKAPDHDILTIIGTRMPDRVVKILHVGTVLAIGEFVCAGDVLGPMIRSGYFGYQTPLHTHLEVRPAADPVRVRGGYPIESLLELDKLEPTMELAGKVSYARRGYAQIQLKNEVLKIVADIGGSPGILDGGIPLYGWFGAHVNAPKMCSSVKLLGKQIGFVTKTSPRSCIAECTAFDSRIGLIPVDLFFMLTPKSRTILVATSKRRGELDLHEGEEIEVTVS